MRLFRYIFALVAVLAAAVGAYADTIPSAFSRPLQWRVGAEVNPAYVPGTNPYLDGRNHLDKRINSSLSGSVRLDFSFGASTREGMLYKGLYQGIGLGGNTYFANRLLGSPFTAYAYQGAPICRIASRLWLGYEWKFGAAIGWKHYNEDDADDNVSVSTTATALMAFGLKLHYAIDQRWSLSAGVEATHFSNGNTSWPNGGVNALGATVTLSYLLNQPQAHVSAPAWLAEEADRGRWMFDIMAFGAWRKRVIIIGDPAERELCPGKYPVAGLQISPLRRLNRWVAVGPALDLQWDQSSGLAPFWVEGTTGDGMKFWRPPFRKQVSVGLSAHAELTTPIFAINAGLGYDFVNPVGNKRFYQSLTLKTFITRHLYLNVGYRLANFNDPENLMLGLGLRL